MKKVFTWILNHLVIILAVLVFVPVLAVSGSLIAKSYQDYQVYEEQYYADVLEVRALSEAQPSAIEIQDSYVSYAKDGSVKSSKSPYKNKLTAYSEDFTVTTDQDLYLDDNCVDLTEKGGKILLKLDLEDISYVDIIFRISSTYAYLNKDGDVERYGVKDLLTNVNFTVNGQTMEDEVDLKNAKGEPEWHNLVMRGFALPQGRVTVEIKSMSNKAALMPQVRSISFISSAAMSIAA